MRFSKSSAKGKVHSNTSLPQETRKSQIDNVKQVAKEDIKNPRVSTRKKSQKLGQKYMQKKQRRP